MKTQLKVKLKFKKYNGCDHFIEVTVVKIISNQLKYLNTTFQQSELGKVLYTSYLYGGAKQSII